MKYFYADEVPIDHSYIIRANIENLPIKRVNGSLNVLEARMFGLPYDEYLRMCRDEYGAEVIGKNSLFPVAYFNDKKKADKLAKLLSERAEILLSKRSNSSK